MPPNTVNIKHPELESEFDSESETGAEADVSEPSPKEPSSMCPQSHLGKLEK